jgi:photosystem II stability/assembly factor-like uncharacterized protein
MKKILLTFITSLTVLCSSAQSWAPSLTTSLNNSLFRSVYFSDATHGWAVGTFYNSTYWAPMIYATTDGGQNWVQQSPPLTWAADLTDVYFIDNQNGWASSSGTTPSYVFKTTDGGATWTATSSGVMGLWGVHFQSATLGWAVGSGFVVKTTDGGTTWVDQLVPNNGDLFDIQFIDAQNGYITGHSEILKTIDGGTTWTSTATPNTVWRGMGVVDINTIHFVGYLNTTGTRIRTTDAGANFTNFASLTSGAATDVEFVDANIGYLVTQSGVVSKTIDGGNAWANDFSDNTYSFEGINIVDPTNIFAVGRNVGDNTAVIFRYSACSGATAPVITSISGLSTSTFSPPCAGTTFTFTAGSASDTFVWTLPADWTITSGATTNTITGTYGQTAGTVSVVATNNCNLSSAPYTTTVITPTVGLPAVPTAINPTTTPTCLNTNQGFGLVGSVSSGNGYSWNWSSNEWTDLNFGAATLNPFGTFTLSSNTGSITVIVNNACGSSAPYTQSYNFNLDAQLPTPVITQSGNSLTTTSVANEYCWREDNSESEFCFTGTSGMTFTPTFAGDYYLVISTVNGCNSGASNTISTTTSINEQELNNISIYPNPANSTVSVSNVIVGSTVTIVDVMGKRVYSTKAVNTTVDLSVEALSNGIYFIEIENNGAVAQKKLVVSK